MRKLTAILCLTIAVLLGSEVRASDLPPCREIQDRHKHNCFADSKTKNYRGEWRHGKKHGQGTYTYNNRNKYVGEFRNGKPHGQGIITYHDGSVWKGIWWNGQLQHTQKFSPFETTQKSFSPAKSAAEQENERLRQENIRLENERLRRENARLKKQKQSQPKQVAKRNEPKTKFIVSKENARSTPGS